MRDLAAADLPIDHTVIPDEPWLLCGIGEASQRRS